MLIERISNPWFRFKVLQATMQGDKRNRLAHDAFYYVIRGYDAFKFQKQKALNEIYEKCPNVLELVSDTRMMVQIQNFCHEAERRGQIVSPAELDWVNQFIGDKMIRTRIEKMIYIILLKASSHWDNIRRDTPWAIPIEEKLELVREVLADESVGAKRKLELAQEFGETKDAFVQAYFLKLLYGRHYEKAESLEVSDPEIIISVILENIDNGYFQDALDIAQRFLPQRADLVEEIRQIQAAINS